MNFTNEISEDVKKWVLDTSKLTKDDLEVLTIINFPKSLGYRDAAQMRIKRMYANGGYINKQTISINDITFTVTSKKVAKWDIAQHSIPTGADQRARQQIEGVLKSKPRQNIYYDGHSMDALLDNILSIFSSPKPTPNAIVEDKPKVEKKKSRKYVLSDDEKEQIKEMAYEKSMDVKEISSDIGAPQTVIKEYLKNLK